MRTFIKFGALALVAIAAITSCYLGYEDGIGSVGIQLPPSRGISDNATTARIYVINGANLLSVGDGTAYKELELQPESEGATAEASVGPVPADTGYRVILVLGSYETGDTGDDVFLPTKYAVSDEFTVYAGQATETNIMSPVNTAFSEVPGVFGRDTLGIVATAAGIYTTTPSQVFYDTGASPGGAISFTAGPFLPDGETANGISLGATSADGEVPWINTNKGIIPYNGPLQTDYDDKGFDVNVLDSGAFRIGTSTYGYIQFDGGLTGLWDNNSAKQWMSKIDLSEFVTGLPVLDLVVQDTGVQVLGYFVTKLGTFIMPDAVLQDPNINTIQLIFDNCDFIQLSINDVVATITSVAVDPSGASTALYLGTPKGAVRVDNTTGIGTTFEGETESVSGTMIALTQDQIVENIAVAGNYVAILTNHFLVYSSDGGDSWHQIPVYASSVGDVNDMLLDSASGKVLLSGSLGIVGIDINS